MIRRGTAAPSCNVEPPVLGQLPYIFGCIFRALIVLPHLIWQTCIGIYAHRTRHPLQLLYERCQIPCSKRAVEPETCYRIMLQCSIKCIQCVTAEQPSAPVIHCGRNHYRNIPLRHFLLYCVKCSFGIQGIIYSLHKEYIHSTVQQAPHLHPVGIRHLLECHIPALRLICIRRKGKRFHSRSNASRHKNIPARVVRCPAGNLCPFQIYLINLLLLPVVSLGNSIATECIGLNYICPCLYIFLMDSLYNILSGKVQDIVVTFTSQKIIGRKSIFLNAGTHCTIKDKDPLPHPLYEITLCNPSSHLISKNLHSQTEFAAQRCGKIVTKV